jgi:diguanylate cyclase (GGDEF)-like protein
MALVIGILAATALLSGRLTAYMAARSRGSRSALTMALIMGATAWWAAGNAAEYLAHDLAVKVAFANLQYLAIAAIPVLWFGLGSSLGQEERGRKVRFPLPVIWIIPALTAILVWTDSALGLVRHSFRLDVQSGFAVIAKEFGPWFWVHSAYSYVFILIGTVLILRAVQASQGTRRAQRVTLVVGTLLPVAANLVYLAGIFPLGNVDPTPLAFSLTGLLAMLNLTRFRFLALVTTAQATAIEQLPDAVVILDRDGTLAYVNAAARSSFATTADAVGKRLVDMGPPYSDLGVARDAESRERGEASVLAHGGRTYEARRSDILRRRRTIGSVVTFFDVTRRVIAEEEMRKANLLLEERIAERTRALEESNLKLTAELEQRRRAERQLTHDVLHDALTGMANRAFALSRIEQLVARTRREPALSFAVLHLDFDGFNTINDRFGHAAGDVFLCEVAARLKRSIREVDLAARLGSDEFLVLLDGYVTLENLDEIIDRIVDNLSVPVYFGASAVIPSASVGIVAGRFDGRDPDSILHDAAIAVQKAKSSGRNLRVVFSDDMRLQVDQRNLLSAALRTAISSGEISLAFQPIVRMVGPAGTVAPNPPGTVAGWEVLARWRHAELGAIGPDRFIPIAEESGLIVPLGAYILLETLKTAAALHGEGLLEDDGQEVKFFAVNVSAIQFGHRDFEELVLSSLDRAQLPRSALHLELTESAIMENREGATKVIERLSREGISFKLDDFGTGYSSLGYLHRIPINCVKIDRSFISRMDLEDPDQSSAGIVRGMISLSHDLRKTVVAEGIETEQQAKMLREYGCDFAQGYYYGKPMDKTALFQQHRAAAGREPVLPPT